MKIVIILLIVSIMSWGLHSKYPKIAYFLSVISFTLILGCRNNITADYSNYEAMFYKIYNDYKIDGFAGLFNIEYIFGYIEPGYSLLNVLINSINNNFKLLLFITAIFTVIPLFKYFNRFKSYGLILILYLLFGTYLEGFNLIRQILAASICIFAFDYINKGKFTSYLIRILFAISIHLTSIVLIPIYFIMRWNTIMNRRTFRIMYLVAAVLLAMSTVAISQMFLDLTHEGEYAYVEGVTAISAMNMLPPLMLLCGCEFLKHLIPNRYSDNELVKFPESEHVRTYIILEHCMYIWCILSVCSVQIPMVTRFASFFSPLAIIYIAETLYGIKHQNNRKIIVLLFTMIIIIYRLSSFGDSYLNQYHFEPFWNY